MGSYSNEVPRMEPSHKQPPGCWLNSHSIKYQSGIQQRRSANIRKQQQSCCYYSQIHYSQCSFSDNLFGARRRIFSVYEFGSLLFSTNGYYNDKHKWLSLMDNCNRVCCCCCCLHLFKPFPPLVCAWLMREESGTCCISIRPSKKVGIYGNAL